jgi:hypothetical protein
MDPNTATKLQEMAAQLHPIKFGDLNKPNLTISKFIDKINDQIESAFSCDLDVLEPIFSESGEITCFKIRSNVLEANFLENIDKIMKLCFELNKLLITSVRPTVKMTKFMK